MTVRSLWRTLLYKRLAELSLSGEVIDLGGSRKSAYSKDFKGDFKLTMANLEADTNQDISLNLEEPFSLKDAQYDHVLCINVLEHIFNYQNVISETKRILKPGGTAIFAVPFLIQVHPSPHDHWRFTGETLERLFKDAGFSEVTVEPIGTGVFGATSQILFNFWKFGIVRQASILTSTFVDAIIARLPIGKNYSKNFYPLGYVVSVRK